MSSEINKHIRETFNVWGEVFVIRVGGAISSIVGDLGAARHSASEYASKHGRENVRLSRIGSTDISKYK